MDQIELIYSSNRSRKILGVRIEDFTISDASGPHLVGTS